MTQQCEKCNSENTGQASFCQECGNPLNQRGVRRQLGWKPVMWDLCLPGAGHYLLGRRITGLLIVGLFLLFFTMSMVYDAKIAMKVANSLLSGTQGVSIDSIRTSIGDQRTSWGEFLSWSYIVIWVAAVLSSARLVMAGKKDKA